MPAKLDRCVESVKKSTWCKKSNCNPYAVCNASIDKNNKYRVMYRVNKTQRWLYWNSGFLSDKKVRTKNAKINIFNTKQDATKRQISLKKTWAKDGFRVVEIR